MSYSLLYSPTSNLPVQATLKRMKGTSPSWFFNLLQVILIFSSKVVAPSVMQCCFHPYHLPCCWMNNLWSHDLHLHQLAYQSRPNNDLITLQFSIHSSHLKYIYQVEQAPAETFPGVSHQGHHQALGCPSSPSLLHVLSPQLTYLSYTRRKI